MLWPIFFIAAQPEEPSLKARSFKKSVKKGRRRALITARSVGLLDTEANTISKATNNATDSSGTSKSGKLEGRSVDIGDRSSGGRSLGDEYAPSSGNML